MFRGKPMSYSDSYSTLHDQYFLRKENLPPLHPTISNHEYSQPAVDGLQLPELMRAHTEESQIAMHSGKNHIRTKTLSSLYLSSGPREISLKENLAFSRRISNRLDSSNTNRPDSVHGFVSIFSRNIWREKKDRYVSHISRVSTSSFMVRDASSGVKSKDKETVNSCNSISIPYNFRHVGHTQQENVSNTTHRAPTELASDPSISHSLHNPADLEGQIHGVDDLHFDNFSSEALCTQTYDERRPFSAVEKFRARQRTVLRKKKIPCERKSILQDSIYNEAGISLHQLDIPSISQQYPVESVPTRMSSRKQSISDSVPSSVTERFCTKSEWENSLSSGVPSTSTQNTKSSYDDYFYCKSREILVKSSDDSWPLPNSTNSSCFGVELPDVEEEEEDSVVSETKTVSVENCGSFDFDEKIFSSVDDLESISGNGSPAEWDPLQTKIDSSIGESLSVCSDVEIGSWESDIDWCYENEVEADCDYRWIEEENKESQQDSTETQEDIQDTQLILQIDEPLYRKSFCPSLLLPEGVQSPGSSPSSAAFTTSPTPETPVNFAQDLYLPITPKVSSPSDSLHMDSFQTGIATGDFQNSLHDGKDCNEHYVNDYFMTISTPKSYNSSIGIFEEGKSKSVHDRSLSCSQSSSGRFSNTRKPTCAKDQKTIHHKYSASFSHTSQLTNSSCISSEPTCISSNHSDSGLVGLKAAFSLGKDVTQAPLLSRRNKTPNIDVRASPISLPISILHDSRSMESLEDGGVLIRRGRSTTRPTPDRKLSAPFLGQGVINTKSKKSRSTSQTSAATGLKCSYGLFPQI